MVHNPGNRSTLTQHDPVTRSKLMHVWPSNRVNIMTGVNNHIPLLLGSDLAQSQVRIGSKLGQTCIDPVWPPPPTLILGGLMKASSFKELDLPKIRFAACDGCIPHFPRCPNRIAYSLIMYILSLGHKIWSIIGMCILNTELSYVTGCIFQLPWTKSLLLCIPLW